jgi:hypothetical protein
MIELFGEFERRLSGGVLFTNPALADAYRSDKSLMTGVAATIQLAASVKTPVVTRGQGLVCRVEPAPSMAALSC